MSDVTGILFTSTLSRIGLLQTVGKASVEMMWYRLPTFLEQIFKSFFSPSAYESDSNDGSVSYTSLILTDFERGMFL